MAGILAATAIAAAAPGVIKAVGSMFGSRKRRREQESAAQELGARKQAYETFEFKDPSVNLTNPFEDLTVNQQQAQFAAQQQQQGLAGTLGGLQQAAGGSGIAALAQTLAQQQSTNLQQASASIGQQEAAIQMQKARGQQTLEQQRAAGQEALEAKEFGRTETLLGMAQSRKAAADQARQQAKQDLIGGLSEAAGAVAGSIGGAPGGGVAKTATGLGNSTMKNYGQSFLDKTANMDLTVPQIGGNPFDKYTN